METALSASVAIAPKFPAVVGVTKLNVPSFVIGKNTMSRFDVVCGSFAFDHLNAAFVEIRKSASSYVDPTGISPEKSNQYVARCIPSNTSFEELPLTYA
jgi:hypothetical protein